MIASEIIELVRAGYTREEIDAMQAATQASDPPQDSTPPAADPQQDPMPPAADPQQDLSARLDDLAAQISALTRATQAANLAGAEQPAQIINPPAIERTLREISGLPTD